MLERQTFYCEQEKFDRYFQKGSLGRERFNVREALK